MRYVISQEILMHPLEPAKRRRTSNSLKMGRMLSKEKTFTRCHCRTTRGGRGQTLGHPASLVYRRGIIRLHQSNITFSSPTTHRALRNSRSYASISDSYARDLPARSPALRFIVMVL